MLRQRLPLLAAALWWGSGAALGFVAVPLLFRYLPSPALAGQTAARLFTAQTWIALACGCALLFAARSAPAPTRWARGALGFVLAGMLLALLNEFGIAPRIVARQNLALWHSVGSAFYLAQWLCAGAVLFKLAEPAEPSQATGDR
jgi:hypothetical protein